MLFLLVVLLFIIVLFVVLIEGFKFFIFSLVGVCLRGWFLVVVEVIRRNIKKYNEKYNLVIIVIIILKLIFIYRKGEGGRLKL